MKYLALVFLLSVSAAAQTSGISSQWDVRATLQAITAHSARLQPLLQQVQPNAWIAAGASETYIKQWNSTRAQADGVKLSAAELSRNPEKLTAALDAFFRLQSLETLLGSLVEGVRKYQNPALADLLSNVMAENSASSHQLRQYVVDLAKLKEQEFAVMDRESQRCRGILTRQPRPARKTEAQ